VKNAWIKLTSTFVGCSERRIVWKVTLRMIIDHHPYRACNRLGRLRATMPTVSRQTAAADQRRGLKVVHSRNDDTANGAGKGENGRTERPGTQGK
jgi:hypothetical protein